jgi:hypothetical protein
MSIRQEIRELPSAPQDLRKFSWTVGGVLLAIGAFLWWRDAAYAPALLWIGGLLAAVGSVVQLAVKPLYYAWMSFAVVLGFVMTRVVLTVFYFVVLTPVGLFFKLIGRDALHRELDRDAPTYWLKKEYPIADRSRFEKFF